MKITTLFLIFALVLGMSLPSFARNNDSKDISKGAERASHAARVFREIMDAPDKGIPDSVLDNAEAIAVFPSILKVGFIVGGRGGSGVVSIKDPQTHQWSEPIFVKLAGGDFGAQIGGQSIDLVLLGMNRKAAELFLSNQFKLGGELGVSAGPVGRNAEASTEAPKFNTGFLSYSRSKGLFIGAVVKGSKIWQDDSLNQAVYGQSHFNTFQDVSKRTPAGVMVFTDTLNQYTKRKGA